MWLAKFDEHYAHVVPLLDEKANLLITELAEVKQLVVEFTQEGTVALDKIGNEVGKFCVKMTADSQKYDALEKEKAEDKANFEATLKEKDSVILRLRESAELAKATIERVPVLEDDVRKMKDEIRKLE